MTLLWTLISLSAEPPMKKFVLFPSCSHLDRVMNLRTFSGPINAGYNIYTIGIYGDLTGTIFNVAPLQVGC